MITDPLFLVRGVHFAATLLAGGTIGLLVLVGEPAGIKARADFVALRHQLTVLIWLALTVAILSGAAWLVLLASDILGASIADVCLHGGAWPVLFDTRFGQVWCARSALALLLGLLMLRPATRSFQLAAAAAFVALPALIGHAGATPRIAGDSHLVSDMVHLLAAGAWLGGLPAFALLLSQAHRRVEAAWHHFAIQATRRFSVVGILSVTALLASGLINSWNLLSGPRDLVTTDYGRLVALKIGLFIAMVAIAAVNRFYLTPRLPEPTALRGLQRNSLAEVCLGLCVLLVVGILGTLPPAAHVHLTPADIPPDAAFVHIHAPGAMADVTIDPGRVGQVKVRIRVLRDDFSDFPTNEVHLNIDPPKPGPLPIYRTAVRRSDGTWEVDRVDLSQAGNWTVKVIVSST
ncbi:MAG: copper homeostasis membrane protein CopD, partial [Pseudolabrys sp.]